MFVLLALSGARVASAASSRSASDTVAPTVEDAIRSVQMPHVQNARDLGGLRGRRGFIPHGRFYRAATLVRVSGEDRAVLLGRGVTLDIDLRTFIEAAQKPDRLAHDTRVGYLRLSLLGSGISDWFRGGGLRGLYVHVLGAHQSALRDVFRAMAAHGEGAVLYHCTSGKDRTGMVTAILLDLAGVDRATIVRDYAISAHYLGRGPASSPPGAIGTFLDVLDTHYGGARGFLARIGVREAEIQSLLAKLGQA
jgi:protein-tyrosine phosphatase